MNQRALDRISKANARTFRPKEADIQIACTQLLELDGWRPLKTDPVSRREWGKGFGEKGMADHLYIRYLWGRLQDNALLFSRVESVQFFHALSQVLWIEWKRPGEKTKPHQDTWHRDERLRGGLTLKAGEDFEATIDGFLAWYRKSGLMRRPI